MVRSRISMLASECDSFHQGCEAFEPVLKFTNLDETISCQAFTFDRLETIWLGYNHGVWTMRKRMCSTTVHLH